MQRRAGLYLLASLFCQLIFALLAAGVQSGAAIVRLDQELTDRLYHWTSGTPTAWAFFSWVTDLGAGWTLTVFACGVVTLVLLAGHLRLALLCAAVMLLNQRSIVLLKEFFARPRPPFVDWPALSFPSGHTQGSTVVYGLAIYLAFLRWPASRFRWAVAAGLGTLIVLVGLSRMMLGVHYLSDVLGGFAMGLAWIGVTAALVAAARQLLSEALSASATGR